MKTSILGFFMLFIFYIVLGYHYLNIGIDFLLFTTFYVFFILILSIIPSLAITYKNILGLGREDNVMLLVNTVHIILGGTLILYFELYRYFLGSITPTTGYILFGITLVVNVVILLEHMNEKWIIKVFSVYILAFVLLHFIEYLLEWNLLFFYPLPAIYLLLHNVTILSYGFLKRR
jgi:hypothetical protein